MSDTPLDDIQQEAHRVVAAGAARGVMLRLLGGLAVALHAPSATREPLARSYGDIDAVIPAKQARATEELFARLGYQPDKQFNLLNGAERLLFYDPPHRRQVDIFVGQFSMCHKIPVAERLATEPLTLPLAELLLTKLQIVQINEKDLRDICALLLDHPIDTGDDETINQARIAQLCGEDWGLWKTITQNLGKAQVFAGHAGLPADSNATIAARAGALLGVLEAAPKTLKWKMRARVGERMPWYELPEEVRKG